MDQQELEIVIRNIDARTTRIEEILPTLATKEDLNALATKEDLNAFATKEEMREEATLTRRHFDVLVEDIRQIVKVIADGHQALDAKIDSAGSDVKPVLANHETRITRLESAASKRR